MKIYTRTGDGGSTGLYGGGRVAKHDPRIAALGAIDELNAVLGVVRTTGLPDPLDAIVARLQNQLFQLGAEVATPEVAQAPAQAPALAPALAPTSHRQAKPLRQADVVELERKIDMCATSLPPLQAFILPGGTAAAAQLHLARAICRRAERDLVALTRQAPVSDTLPKYLNRASDLLFVLARTANVAAGVAEIEWQAAR